jgi:hypothetical protein
LACLGEVETLIEKLLGRELTQHASTESEEVFGSGFSLHDYTQSDGDFADRPPPMRYSLS